MLEAAMLEEATLTGYEPAAFKTVACCELGTASEEEAFPVC